MSEDWRKIDDLVGKVKRQIQDKTDMSLGMDDIDESEFIQPYEFSGSSAKKKRSRASRELIRYIIVGLAIFFTFFLVSNWPAYKVLMNYYLFGTGSTNVFSTSDSIDPESTPLKVASALETSTRQKIKVDLDIPVTAPDDRLIISKFDLSVPVVTVSDSLIYDEDSLVLETAIQNALQRGIVRYPGTAEPGSKGNTFITGHSSYYLWDPGKYKDVFALLPKIQIDDEITIYYKQKEYKYKVKSKKEVWPDQVDVLKQTNDYRLTLMTCVPVGTNLRRLIITAELVP